MHISIRISRGEKKKKKKVAHLERPETSQRICLAAKFAWNGCTHKSTGDYITADFTATEILTIPNERAHINHNRNRASPYKQQGTVVTRCH